MNRMCDLNPIQSVCCKSLSYLNLHPGQWNVYHAHQFTENQIICFCYKCYMSKHMNVFKKRLIKVHMALNRALYVTYALRHAVGSCSSYSICQVNVTPIFRTLVKGITQLSKRSAILMHFSRIFHDCL